MTTTLRPDGPEEPLPGGGRTRRYAVCVNGRPVGAVRVAARAQGPAPVGEISELEITEGRRRGRGTTALLAAEEVLRDWGCTRLDVTVPAAAEGALRLATALGYQERMRNMAKQLAGPPPELPAGLAEQPIGAADFPRWLAESQQRYAGSQRASGMSEEQAQALAAAVAAQLSQGADSPDTVLRYLVPAGSPDGQPAGSLWVQLRGHKEPDGSPIAWVMTVEVAEGSRGRGHGRALMLIAERACLAAGLSDLGLNVFAGNEVAVGLYTSLGYRTTRCVLGKTL